MRNFAAYDVALELAKEMKPIIEELRRRSAEAGKQVERAMISVLFNIAEGNKRAGKDPVRFFVMARGSVSELQAALDLASVWQWPVKRARGLLDRERGLLYGLIQWKARRAPGAAPMHVLKARSTKRPRGRATTFPRKPVTSLQLRSEETLCDRRTTRFRGDALRRALRRLKRFRETLRDRTHETFPRRRPFASPTLSRQA